MSDLAITVIATAFATLLATGAVSFWMQRRLYLVVPQLFPHSNVSGSGSIVEISVLNKGQRNESAIRIVLDAKLTYEFVALTHPMFSIERNIISIDRLARGDEASVILSAEGGGFDKSSIIEFNSAETKGKVLTKSTEAFSATDMLAGSIFIALFIALPIGGFYAGQSVSEDDVSIWDRQVPPELATLGWDNIEAYVNSKLYIEEEPQFFPISIKDIEIKGSIATVRFTAENKLPERMKVTATLLSPADEEADKPIELNRFIHDSVVFPNDTKTLELTGYLPESYEQRYLILNIALQSGGASAYNIEKFLELE